MADDFSSASGADTSANDPAWMDGMAMDWGGHLKIRGQASWPSEDSPYSLVGRRTYYDGSAEARLNNELYFSKTAKLATHYEMALSGGDTRRKRNELVRQFPGLVNSGFFGPQPPDDDRRLLSLTSVISEKDDHILYHRLDRLVLTLKPDWGVVRIGRQAATWGNGLLFNPMDLFNPFSPTDIERDYKLGDDMLSVQAAVFETGSFQMLYMPRRNPETSDVSWDHSSLAGKYHLFAGMTEFDFMAARHYQDHVLGVGSVGCLGGAAWRMDLTWTRLNPDSPSEDFFSFIANLDYSWVWLEKNLYGFIEFFYSGIGEEDYQKALENPDILERIDRGELYTLGRTYIGGNLRVELHPLFNAALTTIVSLRDPSGILQPRAIYDISQNTQILIGANVLWGSRGSEFGGVPIPGTDFTTRAADSAYVWVSYYF